MQNQQTKPSRSNCKRPKHTSMKHGIPKKITTGSNIRAGSSSECFSDGFGLCCFIFCGETGRAHFGLWEPSSYCSYLWVSIMHAMSLILVESEPTGMDSA